MTTRTTAAMGQPCWMDLSTTDVAGARRFYPAVFGWEPQEGSEEFGGYFMFLRDGAPVAGAAPDMTGGAVASQWSTYFAVADAADALARAQAAGAHVVVPAMAIADLGAMGVAVDPTGATFGVWAPDQFQGFAVLDEVRAPRWFELHTRDHDAAVDFYRAVFGWETSPMGNDPQARYTVARDGETNFAGVMDATGHLPESTAPHWAVYVGVDDTDAAVAAALGAGGSVVAPAMDTPFGRLATIADTSGAHLRVMQG